MQNEEAVAALATKQFKRKRSDGVEIIPQKSTAVTDVMEMALSNRKRLGRVKYGDTDEDFQRFTDGSFEYLDYIRVKCSESAIDEKSGLIPTIEGWALSLGVSRKVIMMYERRGGRWADFIDAFRNAIYDAKVQLASTGRIPPAVAIFDLCNNVPGYRDVKQISFTETEAEKPRMTADEIRQRIGLLDNVTEE